MFKKNPKISIMGMGYVGLPLALEFSKYYNVNGFDLNLERIIDLKHGIDKNLQFKKKEILKKKNNLFKQTNNPQGYRYFYCNCANST